MSETLMTLGVFFGIVAALYFIITKTVAAEKRESTFLEEQADLMSEEELEDFGVCPKELQSHISRIRYRPTVFIE